MLISNKLTKVVADHLLLMELGFTPCSKFAKKVTRMAPFLFVWRSLGPFARAERGVLHPLRRPLLGGDCERRGEGGVKVVYPLFGHTLRV